MRGVVDCRVPHAGRTDGPLASLQGARDAIRRQKAAAPLAEPVQVLIADGHMGSHSPWCSRRKTAVPSKVRSCIKLHPAHIPCSQAVARLRDSSRHQTATGQLAFPQPRGEWYFEQLWVNGRRATRARSPNKFYYYVANALKQGIDSATGKPAQ